MPGLEPGALKSVGVQIPPGLPILMSKIVVDRNDKCFGAYKCPSSSASSFSAELVRCYEGLPVQFYLEVITTGQHRSEIIFVRGFCRNCLYQSMVEYNKDPKVTSVKALNDDEFEVYKVMEQ